VFPPACALPVIDIRNSYSGDASERHAVAKAMRAACLDKGFFYITGHGMDDSLISDILAQAQLFFSLPEPAKRLVDKKLSIANRGYEPLGGQRLEQGAHADSKESFYIGRDLALSHPQVLAGRFNHGPNVWPAGLARFRPVAERYFTAMDALARTLIRAIAIALGLHEGYFDRFCLEPIATLRLLHYPPQPPDADAATRGAGAHTDFGCITILLQDVNSGLQVFDRRSNTWITAAPIPGTFVVNLGDLIERWTNGRFSSTRHRVINTSGRERHSVAFFYSGNPDYTIECLPTCLEADEIPRYPTTTVEEHLRDCYRTTYRGT
jgi:isopenicillin N synthase-like dioxygenase